MTDNSSDTPGGIVFPPLIPLWVLVVAIMLNSVMPLELLNHVPLLGKIVGTIIAFVVGLGIVIGADRIFGASAQTFDRRSRHWRSRPRVLFAWTRNPMYVGDSIVPPAYRHTQVWPTNTGGHGQLAWCELTRILPAARWSKKRHRFLVELMRKFELCFPLESESETELVPELLPDKTPALDDWNPVECLVFLYQYPVLPHGVLPRFITRTHPKSRNRDRSGVVLAREVAVKGHPR